MTYTTGIYIVYLKNNNSKGKTLPFPEVRGINKKN